MTWPFNPSPGSGRRVARPEPFTNRLARFVRRAFLICMLLVLTTSGSFGAWSMYRFLYQSGNFKIQEIEIHARTDEMKQEARAWLEKRFAKTGNNLCRQDRQILAFQLGLLPRAKSAVVTKLYPDTLRVDFEERIPIIIALLDEPFLMDEDGVLLARIAPENMRKLGLPVLTGVHDAACRPGDKIKKERLSDILNTVSFISGNEIRLKKMIDEWHINGRSEVTAILNTHTEVRFGTTPPIERLDYLITLLDMDKDLENKKYIDLRFDRQIVLGERQ